MFFGAKIMTILKLKCDQNCGSGLARECSLSVDKDVD